MQRVAGSKGRVVGLLFMQYNSQGRPKPLWGPKQNFIWGPLGAANMTGYCQSLIIHRL